MKKKFGILIILLLGISLIHNTSYFCQKDVNVKVSTIIEHNNDLNIFQTTPKKFIKAANIRYTSDYYSKTNFKKILKHNKSLSIYANIYKYNIFFALLKFSIIACMLFIILSAYRKQPKIQLTKKENFLLSFLAIYQPINIYIANMIELPLLKSCLIIGSIYIYFLIINFCINLIQKNNKLLAILLSIFITIITLNLYQLEYIFKNNLSLLVFIFTVIYVIANISDKILKKISTTLTVTLITLTILNFIIQATNITYNNFIAKQNIKVEKETINSYDRNRNIYIILLDQYSGQNILEKKFNFDNKEFISALQQEGFYVFPKMYSNYNYTYASIPTILNLDYIENTNYSKGSDVINNSLIYKLAKQNNYETIFQKSYVFDIKSKYIDNVYSQEQNYNFMYINLFLGNSIFKNEITKFVPNTSQDIFYYPKNINKKHFVFEHVMLFHPPFIYNKDGSKLPIEYNLNIDHGYFPNLQYHNKEVINYIKYLKSINAQNPPVIIVTGDHGMRADDIFESNFSTFTAYFSPEQNYTHIKKSKTLLNFFINFVNYEFHTNIPNKTDKLEYVIQTNPNQEFTIFKEVQTAKDYAKDYLK